MYWTLELASKLEDAPWPATKDELIDYAIRTGAPLEGEKSPMPNTCWTCKSPDVPRLMEENGIAELVPACLFCWHNCWSGACVE